MRVVVTRDVIVGMVYNNHLTRCSLLVAQFLASVGDVVIEFVSS